MCLEIIEDPQKFLFMWVSSVDIYHIRNQNLRDFVTFINLFEITLNHLYVAIAFLMKSNCFLT